LWQIQPSRDLSADVIPTHLSRLLREPIESFAHDVLTLSPRRKREKGGVGVFFLRKTDIFIDGF
jgi:hypothetical protein